ncbi:MAG: hypothetical protein K8Q92_00205 [Methylophilales bacterium]|nr:hypothetical protein [Methylophilales bacterium]
MSSPLADQNVQIPDCRQCVHYYITWDTSFPNGCRAMDFKSKRLPHLDVLESNGQYCMTFEPKPDNRS